jgi:hypothetical protein
MATMFPHFARDVSASPASVDPSKELRTQTHVVESSDQHRDSGCRSAVLFLRRSVDADTSYTATRGPESTSQSTQAIYLITIPIGGMWDGWKTFHYRRSP